MTARRVLLTGDSHVAAPGQVIRIFDDEFPNYAYQYLGAGMFLNKLDVFRVNPAETLLEVFGERENFNFPAYQDPREDDLYIVSMAMNPRPFTRTMDWQAFTPGQCWRANGAYPISAQFMDALIEASATRYLRFLRSMKAIGLNVAVLSPPRTFEDKPFKDAEDRDLQVILWDLYQGRIRRLLEDLQIQVIYQPASTLNGQGFTRAAFRQSSEDFVHGSLEYGLLVLRKIAKLERAGRL